MIPKAFLVNAGMVLPLFGANTTKLDDVHANVFEAINGENVRERPS